MTDNRETKAFAGEWQIKAADQGIVEAVIATLGVVDKDEDIIRPGAIENGAEVSMSSYGHDAIYGEQPAGKGTVNVRGDKLVYAGRVFLGTQRGRETLEVLKEMGSLAQWSFGFRILGSEIPTEEERKQGARRILTKLDAFEVSPVTIGAGVGTGTLSAKQHVATPSPFDVHHAEIAAIAQRNERDLAAAQLKAIDQRVAQIFSKVR